MSITPEFTKGSKFKMEDGNFYTAHDTIERKWQHLNFFQHKCYLHAQVPKVKQSDGRTKTQQVPRAGKGSGFTLLSEASSMLLIENEMPVSKAARVLRVYPKRLWNVFDYWISKAHKEDEIILLVAQVRPTYFGNYVHIILAQLEPKQLAHFAPKWVAHNGAIYPQREKDQIVSVKALNILIRN